MRSKNGRINGYNPYKKKADCEFASALSAYAKRALEHEIRCDNGPEKVVCKDV